MWTNEYVAEKLRQFEDERLSRVRIATVRQTFSRRTTVTGRLAAVSGRLLRRFGEALEYWATPAGQREQEGSFARRNRTHDQMASRRMG